MVDAGAGFSVPLAARRSGVVAAFGAFAVMAAACGSSGSSPVASPGSGSPSASTPAAVIGLASLTLSVAQVTPTMRGKPGGPVTEPHHYTYTGLKGPDGATLSNVCGRATFPSDGDRAARRQVAFIQGGLEAASQEVVRYQPGGAALALQELRAATTSCPKTFQISKGSVASRIAVDASDSSLLPEQVAIQYSITQPQGPRTWEVDVYQFDGNYLSAFYVFNSKLSFVKTTAEQLARLAAAKLRANVGNE
jgi:hypothetical protein